MKGNKEIKITYCELEDVDQKQVDAAFDILFNEVICLDNLGKSASE